MHISICSYIPKGYDKIEHLKKETKTMKVTKDTIIGDILDVNAEAAAPIFFGMGMHCLGCPASRGESVEQACMVHGVDCGALLEKLNQEIAAKEA